MGCLVVLLLLALLFGGGFALSVFKIAAVVWVLIIVVSAIASVAVTWIVHRARR